ncbi:tRNA guanosine(34) transglycosylase Tgt [Blattabacterium cuenoti]|uniref:tRNA guanosine(34) transglycosylase Tgt n=1 Tax=Blattabacterium cuenoti TaxID=1653831 RepID=UPI00163B6888|nr:tRNA guanosine(34) transglycosylase Tgt [Blattabacterium cuenoti]
MKFFLKKTDKSSKARAGLLKTDHGEIETPVFMPVATKGFVKSILNKELNKTSNIILGNAYHLYFNPGIKILYESGGLHSFMNWKKSILTDSGGYQVFSMKKINQITDEGVKFKSVIDGSTHFFSPEKSMEIQRFIGGDIIMSFDDCPTFPCDFNTAKISMERTFLWMNKCYFFLKKNPEFYNHKQSFFPVIQGSVYPELRENFINKIYNSEMEIEGYAIGGLSLGEKKEKTYKIINLLTNKLPYKKPRYLMGVGEPSDILEHISLGIDMFDCVIPTRNGRHGMLFTWNGIINIKNKKWKYDYSCIDKLGNSHVDKFYSKSYLRHLFISKDSIGKEIASIHNLFFYKNLLEKARFHIMNNNFSTWKNKMIPFLKNRLQ